MARARSLTSCSGICRKVPLLAVKTSGRWMDAVYPWDLIRLNGAALDFQGQHLAGSVEKGVILKGDVAIGTGSQIRSGCYIEGPVIIGEGCDIGPQVTIMPSTSIGNGVSIGPYSYIEESLIGEQRQPVFALSSISLRARRRSHPAGQRCIPAGAAMSRVDHEFFNIKKIGALIGESTSDRSWRCDRAGIHHRRGMPAIEPRRGSREHWTTGASWSEMCGIIGYTGPRQAVDVLLDALKRLEYRGYDSAGIAIVGSSIEISKDKGEIAYLESTCPGPWAASGSAIPGGRPAGSRPRRTPTPSWTAAGKLAVVHNGIIENYKDLKKKLEDEGHMFTSETDTEVMVHLMEKHYQGDPHEPWTEALKEVKGTYAVVPSEGQRGSVAARKENPLVVGLGVGENFIASDVTALLNYTNKVLYSWTARSVDISRPRSPSTTERQRVTSGRPEIITWTAEDAQKGGFEHFMLKEIFEEPSAIHNSLLGNLDGVEDGSFLVERRFQLGEDRGLRHLLQRGHGRQIHHRAVGQDPHHRGAGIGIPLRREGQGDAPWSY